MSSMQMMNDANERRALKRRPRFGTLATTFLAGVLALAACEGDNLFSGGQAGRSNQGQPIVASITSPVSVAEGGRLDVRVKAIAPAGMQRIDIRFRRGVVQDHPGFSFDGTRTDTVTVDASVDVPGPVQDSIIEVTAFATDKLGRVSEQVIRLVRVESRTLPIVTVSVTPSGTANIGDTLRIRVSGRDNFGLQSLGYVILNAAGDTIRGPTLALVTGVLRDTVFAVALPAGLSAGSVRVIGIAVNNQQLRGVSSPLALELVDLLGPSVDILVPQQDEAFPLADSILVRVHVVDSGGIAELRLKGVAIRQDPLQNAVVVDRYIERVIPFPQAPSTTLPKDTIVQRFLRPTADTTSEAVYIIATARDNAGNVRADTVRIIDGPRVVILNPVAGSIVGVNSTLLVQISATDRVAGLDSVMLVVGGVQQQTIAIRNLSPLSVLDTTIAIPTGPTTGPLTLTPGVWNRRGVGGFAQPVNVTVGSTAVSDTALPRVQRTVQTSDRIELNDSIAITVRATDGFGTGIRRMGVVIVAIPDGGTLPSRTLARSTNVFDPPLSGTPERTFNVALSEVYSLTEAIFPRQFTLQVHAFAVDAAGNCGASVQTTLSAAACTTINVGGITYFTAAGVSPAQLQITVVAGESVTLPGGGRIADAVVDAPRRKVYLSNIQNNKVEIFNLDSNTFDLTGFSNRRGLVGAAPWGMVISNAGDSLYVANSGGTNVSILPLDGPGYMVEDVARRIQTPNTILTDITITLGENSAVRYEQKVTGFSDRPQFLAQHNSGVLVYSTLPTTAARPGTVRYVDVNVGALPEVYLLNLGGVVQSENSLALAHVDSVIVVRQQTQDRVVIYDHIPGTNTPISSDVLAIDSAIIDIRDKGSDVEVFAGSWDVARVGLSDTTFIAASTDRNTIAIGEGSKSPFGRVMLCCTITPGTPVKLGLSAQIQVDDLVDNASERVFGVGLNQDGALGVARGTQAAYYFDRSLRLQGEFRSGMAGGAGGASLHPQHTGITNTPSDLALSFLATANRTIKIVDTRHFFERGEIAIRDNVVGPLRAVVPDASENAGLSSTDPNYILVKLIAVTAGNNVVIVDVRRKDVDG